MRLKNIWDTITWVIQHTGPSRKKRRRVDSQARHKANTPHGAAKTRPHNWSRDKHKRRKLQKARRKQSWRCKGNNSR